MYSGRGDETSTDVARVSDDCVSCKMGEDGMGIEHLWHHGWSRVEGVMPTAADRGCLRGSGC